MPEEVVLRVAARFQTTAQKQAETPSEDVLVALKDALEVHTAMRRWVGHFPNVLREAEQEAQGLPRGWVWQDRFVRFFEAYDSFEERLGDIDDRLLMANLLTLEVARSATEEPPLKARVSYAINDFQFFAHPHLGQDHIAYVVRTLKEWAATFFTWTNESIRMLQKEIREESHRIQHGSA